MAIYTTGAYLRPMEINKVWVWVVSGFEDDSYKDGQLCNPKITAENAKNLLEVDDEV